MIEDERDVPPDDFGSENRRIRVSSEIGEDERLGVVVEGKGVADKRRTEVAGREFIGIDPGLPEPRRHVFE